MKVFKYIFEHKALTLLVIILLCFQAFLSMIFPFMTSKIINVGIQQKGIENQAPDYISSEHLKAILLLTNDDFVSASYDYDNNDYNINQTGKDNIQKLNEIIQNPIIYVNSDTYNNLVDKSQVRQSYEQFISQQNKDTLKQKAYQASYKEQENLGYDMQAKQMNYLYINCALMLLLTLLTALIVFVQNCTANAVSQCIALDKRKQLFESVMSFNNDQINKFSESSLITRATNDINLIQGSAMLVIQGVLYAPIIVGVGIYFTIQTAPSLFWIIGLSIILVCIAVVFLIKWTIPIFSKMQRLIDKVNLISREILSGLYVTRAFNRQKHEEKRFNKASHDLYKVQLFTGRLTATITPLLTLGYNAISILVLLVGGLYVNTGSLQVGDLIAFTSYSLMVVSAFVNIGMFIGTLPRVSVAVQRIENVIGSGNVEKVYEKVKDNSYKPQEIVFNNVCFSYEKNKNYAVKGLSFTLKPGSTNGIVGTVGSGKSTIVRLLMRLNEVDQGSIMFNGKDSKEYRIVDYRTNFGYAPQKSFLFSGTVESNVGYGTDSEHLEHYIKVAQADKFVEQSKDGLQRKISQDSTNISGGQRQRLSIARALATDAPVLVFDDCFSALDFTTEQKLRNELHESFKDNTKVIVSSRLASVKDADNIIVLENGEIVGQGTHDELMKSCAEYINIAKAQLGDNN